MWQPLRVDRYSTADVEPKERFEAWNSLWPVTAQLYHTQPLEPFRASSSVVQLGGISLVYVDIAAQRWKRDKYLVDLGNDALTFTINLDGRAAGVAGKLDWAQSVGSAVLVDQSQTSDHNSAGGRSIGMAVPRPMAIEAGLDVESLHGVTLNAAEIAMFTSHALQVREALPRFAAADAQRLGRTILDMLVLSLKAADRTEAGGFREDSATLLVRARREIHAHLGSPTLTAANLCRRLGVSRSTLHRLFEEHGGVQAYAREVRLETARHALVNPASGERIGEIAERLGFSDAAHLSRLFKARFGETPRDFRARSVRSR